jgi:hypothetical protein
MQLGFCLAGVREEREKQLRADLVNERLHPSHLTTLKTTKELLNCVPYVVKPYR